MKENKEPDIASERCSSRSSAPDTLPKSTSQHSRFRMSTKRAVPVMSPLGLAVYRMPALQNGYTVWMPASKLEVHHHDARRDIRARRQQVLSSGYLAKVHLVVQLILHVHKARCLWNVPPRPGHIQDACTRPGHAHNHTAALTEENATYSLEDSKLWTIR